MNLTLTSHQPALSIIIPVFNSEQAIAGCLQSIMVQHFTDYEVIVQDGGSTDGTPSIVTAFQQNYPARRILFFRESDRGIYDAMNKAVTHATGTWLYFLGSDDSLFDENVLTTVFDIIKKAPALDLVYGNVLRIHSKQIHYGRFDIEKLLNHNICHQAIFVTRAAFLRYGPFDEIYPACADWDFNLKLFMNKGRVKYTDLVVANYNEDGFSNKVRDELFFDSLKKRREAYLRHWGHYSRSILKRIVGKIRKRLPGSKQAQ